MKVFITGGGGFVGRNFIEYLLSCAPEAELLCLLRNPDQADWLQAPNKFSTRVQFVQGDLLEPDTYRQALYSCDAIMHAAALVGLRNGQEFYRANTETTQRLIEAARHAPNLSRLVFVSSISAVDRPMNQTATGPMDESTPPRPNTDYGKSKLEAERLIQASGLPFVILRPSYIYGSYPRRGSSMDRILYDVRDSKPYTQIPFPGRASEIYAPDLADALWTAMRHPAAANEVFFASTAEPVMVGQAYPAIAAALGTPYQAREVSPEALRRLREYTYRKYPAQPLVRVMFEDSFYCSSQKLRSLLNWEPKTTLSDGIAKTIGWYRAQGLLT